MSPSASSERSSAVSWAQVAPRRRPRSARPASSTAPARSGVEVHGRADDESDRTALPQVAHEVGEVGGRHADAEDQRTGWVHGFVLGVVDDDATDVTLVFRVARDELEHGVAQVVEDPSQARARPLAHGSQDRGVGHGRRLRTGSTRSTS